MFDPDANAARIDRRMVYLGTCLIAGIRLARASQLNVRVVPTIKAIEESVELAQIRKVDCIAQQWRHPRSSSIPLPERLAGSSSLHLLLLVPLRPVRLRRSHPGQLKQGQPNQLSRHRHAGGKRAILRQRNHDGIGHGRVHCDADRSGAWQRTKCEPVK